MGFASRVYENRRSVVSVGAVALFAAGLVSFALLYEGEATADVELNDSGVWVTQTAEGKLGRFNYEARALDGILLANAASFDVEQDAQRVLLDSTASSSASAVNPAQLVLNGTMKFPAGSQVAAGGATTAVYDKKTGRAWVLPFDSASFDEKRLKPTVKVGRAGHLVVSNDGTVFLAVPADSTLYTIATSTHGVARSVEESALPLTADAEVRVSSVGEEPVVLDQSTGNLVLPSGELVKVEDGAQGMLQQPSEDADVVVVATTKGLVTQPLEGEKASKLDYEGVASSTPAAPVQLNGCIYGAWSSGQVVRDCAGTDSDFDEVLDGMDPSSRLVYRVNRDVIVLNDAMSGVLWMAADQFEKVDDWKIKEPYDAEGRKSETEESTPELVDNFVAERDKPNRRPEPKDDNLGVRPGRTTVLNVLGNDMDKDGDVLTASVIGTPKGDIGVDRVLDGAALQADVPAGATGTTTFKYEVDDGRENGTADASVSVRVVPLEENNPPEQPGDPVLVVGQEKMASIKVLPYFKDPDGDDLFLSNASTTDPLDEVRFRPDGTVEFRDGGASVGRKIVDVVVSDSMGMPIEGKLLVDVVASNVPPVAVQDHVTVQTGEPITVHPLKNDHDANGDQLRLTRVEGPEPATIVQNQTTGTFRFKSDKAGAYDVTYQISDGPNARLGLARVDVVDPPREAGAPVVVSDQVLLPTGGTALVDVLANDTDPAGGVLVVQGVDVPADAPVSVSVLNHQILKVSELKRLDEPALVTYTVANGAGTVTGQVRVVPIPAPDQLRPPEAGPDVATVHVGDVVTVPVLKNDTHPDGLALTLTDELQESPPASAGEAFVSEDTVRFKAGTKAGTHYAVYEVEDANGQKDSAQLTINVVGGRANSAPQLPDITARVLSGGIVRIPLALDGTDPDGDHVTLSSISGAPSQGKARIADGFIDYQAAQSSSGLDTFTYQVLDTRGAPAEGVVQVGIAATPAANQKPQATDDETTVRPGRAVSVRALENDSDPDGDQIGLVGKGFEGTEDVKPEAVDDQVVVTTPETAGAYSFYYAVQDTYEARASGAITLNVDPKAPLLRPIAHDDVVTADDVQGSTHVTVDVLANDVDPDGVAADLEVAVDPALEGVTVTDDGAVRVQLAQDARVVTYTVTDMDDLKAKAFVRVPGNQMRPHVKPGQGALKATSGEPLTIDIAEHVVVRDGREPLITEEKTVKALEGRSVAKDQDTIVYTSTEDYAGPASVSFEVTDGEGPDDPKGLTSVLTLPIDVTPAKNMPPTINGAPVLQVAAGEQASVDLSRYVDDPDGDPLTFDVKSKEGIKVSVTGATVTGQVDPSISKGTFVALPMTLSDGKNPAVRAELTVQVVPSTRPLVKTAPDQVLDAHQGRRTTIPVLANDTNPFPGKALTLSGVPTVDIGNGTAAYSGDQLVVTPSADFTGAMLVRYRVQDVTKDPDREVDGIAKLTVLGKPDAPRAPRVEEVRSETVVLSWDQPDNNGAEITGYTVTASNGQEHACATTTCTFDGLKNNVKYTFKVTATNEVDESDPSPASREARPDQKPDRPAPPTLKFGDRELKVSWQNRSYTDRSPIDCVNLEISPAPANGVIQKTCVRTSSVIWTGLDNGTAYTVRVQAKNDAPDPSEWSGPSAPEVPAAPPARPADPQATRVNDSDGGQITVTWTAPANNGDAVKSYRLDVFRDGTKVRTITTIETTQAVRDLSTNSSYRFAVTARNKAGNSPVSAKSNEIVPFGEPTRPNRPTAALGTTTSGQADVRWNGIDTFRGTGGRYEVQANGANVKGAGTATSFTYTGLKNGTSYTFQARACNDYTCSAWSDSSNAVVPYGPPPMPTITATGGDRKVTFTWDARGTNGRPTTVRVTGAIESSATSGSRSAPAGYSDTKKACVTVTDTENQSRQACAQDTSDVRPDPRAWVTRGSKIPNPTSGCGTGDCWYFMVNTQDFDAGRYTVGCQDYDGSWASFRTVSNVSVPANGQVQLSCYYGETQRVRVVIGGKAYEDRAW